MDLSRYTSNPEAYTYIIQFRGSLTENTGKWYFAGIGKNFFPRQ